MPRSALAAGLAPLLLLLAAAPIRAQTGTLVVTVTAEGGPLAGADVVALGEAGGAATTDGDGAARLVLPAGRRRVAVSRLGFESDTLAAAVAAGRETALAVALVPRPVEVSTIVVSATRTRRMVKDEPLPVHVVPPEELEENATLAPGTLTQMLNELAGAQFRPAAATLGGATLRLQGLPGRYTQVLVDGLPLYGEEPGVFELLQAPPLDLARIEVVKGTASALYGGSALGGVLNLVSKRPGGEPGAIASQTSRGGTDLVGFGTGDLGGAWGWTFLGGLHRQSADDGDGDGWADVPRYRRAVVRPRLFRESPSGTTLVTLGFTGEDRAGGTVEGATAPDGAPFPVELDTRRVDGGLVVDRFLPGDRLLAVRASGMLQRHRHVFGESADIHHHATGFVESSVSGEDGSHAWVVGAAFEADGLRSAMRPDLGHTWTVPALFASDDWRVSERWTVSAAARLDVHDEFGAQWSPRLSALLRLPGETSLRLSAGRGFAPPDPIVERTRETGLARVEVPRALDVERATTASADLHRVWGPLEIDAGLFGSWIEDPLEIVEAGPDRIALGNAAGPSKTFGSEVLGAFHRGRLHVLASWVWERATEADPGGGRRDTPYVPRHLAAIDGIWEDEAIGRIGFEATYVGSQALEDDPRLDRGQPYWTVLVAGEKRFGEVGVFASVDDVFDVRQTDFEPIVRPTRAADGRWTVDAWAPREGRTFRIGVRLAD